VRLARAQTALLAALAATTVVSVFASELLLSLSLVVLLLRVVRKDVRLRRTPVDTPLAAFAVWTLLAACFALQPALAHESAKKLLLFLLFYLALEVTTDAERREQVLAAVLLGGLALVALMAAQHAFLGYDRLDRRPPGFLGHYMTAAGLTLCVLLMAAARLAFAPRAVRLRDAWLAGVVLAGVAVLTAFCAAGYPVTATRVFVLGLALLAARLALAPVETVRAAAAAVSLLVVPLAAWALVVSQTRGAWLGAAAGLALLAAVRAPRLLALGAALLLLLVLARPQALGSRLTLSDASSVDRYYMWQAGLDMVLDKPVFGQGPGMILSAYPRYRWPEAPNPQAPHLHDNVLQIAAERGLPGLAFFLWWFGATALAAWRQARAARQSRGADAAAAFGVLSVLAAVFVAGLVEYNLGDSEVLMLVLLLSSMPFALARARGADAPA